jgi:hypothetical protein
VIRPTTVQIASGISTHDEDAERALMATQLVGIHQRLWASI